MHKPGQPRTDVDLFTEACLPPSKWGSRGCCVSQEIVGLWLILWLGTGVSMDAAWQKRGCSPALPSCRRLDGSRTSPPWSLASGIQGLYCLRSHLWSAAPPTAGVRSPRSLIGEPEDHSCSCCPKHAKMLTALSEGIGGAAGVDGFSRTTVYKLLWYALLRQAGCRIGWWWLQRGPVESHCQGNLIIITRRRIP